MNTQNKQYIGTYKVVKFFKVSQRREILARGLSRDEAKRLTSQYPSTSRSFVGFDKQFSADKYFV